MANQLRQQFMQYPTRSLIALQRRTINSIREEVHIASMADLVEDRYEEGSNVFLLVRLFITLTLLIEERSTFSHSTIQ